RQDERRLGGRQLAGELLQRRGVDTALSRRLLDAALAGERVGTAQLRSRRARQPRVGVQPGERATRADAHEARRTVELRARIGKIELPRYVRAPPFEEGGAERDDEPRVG